MMHTRKTKRFSPHAIRTARQMLGLTHDEFGAPLKKTGRTVRNWEVGVTSPTIRDLDAICHQYHLSIEYFLTAQLGRPS